MKKREYITAEQSRRILGVAPATFARLLREGVLKFKTTPLDKRVKLINKDHVTKLRDKYKLAR